MFREVGVPFVPLAAVAEDTLRHSLRDNPLAVIAVQKKDPYSLAVPHQKRGMDLLLALVLDVGNGKSFAVVPQRQPYFEVAAVA